MLHASAPSAKRPLPFSTPSPLKKRNPLLFFATLFASCCCVKLCSSKYSFLFLSPFCTFFIFFACFIYTVFMGFCFVCLFVSFMEMVELIYNDDDEKEEQQKQQQKIPPLCAVQRVSSFASLPVDLCSTRLNNRLSRSSSVSIRLSTETLFHRSEQSLIPKWVVGPDWSCSLYTLSAAHDVHFRRLIAVRLGAEKKSK